MRAHILFFILLFSLSNSTFAQKKSFFEMRQDERTQWRIGQGVSIGEPTGIQFSFYKARDICHFHKHLTFDIYAGYEGLLYDAVIVQANPTWSSGGIRFGASLKWYFPVKLLKAMPYLGLGAESGTRIMNGSSLFSNDALAMLGLEWNVLPFRLSRSKRAIVTMFIEGKYNYCLSSDYNYILPSIGFKFHVL